MTRHLAKHGAGHVVIGIDPGRDEATAFVLMRPLSTEELSQRTGLGSFEVVGTVLWESPPCAGFTKPTMKPIEPISVRFKP